MKDQVALIILYDEDNKLLLQHRTCDTPRLPGYWAFFGGKVEENETPKAAVIREAKEELNCRITIPELVIEKNFILPGVQEGHMYVFVEAYFGDKAQLQLCEGQGWGWFTEDETTQLQMIDHDRDVIKKVSEHVRSLDRGGKRK